nr:MAG TPA: putative tail-component [Caudoviricetes sp.]
MKVDVFDLKSINNAKDCLTKYRDSIEYQTNQTVKRLTQMGYEYMMSIVKFNSGELASSISWNFDSKQNKGIIRVGADYALFVEFGTGIVGARSPHPEPENWQYDINSHGEKGWWYFDEKQNRYRWTKGQEASAFVYRTYEFMKKEAINEVEIKISGSSK